MSIYDMASVPILQANLKRHVFVCSGKSCSANDSDATFNALSEQLAAKGLLYKKKSSPGGSVILTTCGSVGLCAVGPAVLVYPDGVWYHNVTPADVAELIEQHFGLGHPLERLLALTIQK